ncbi:hypothetical protein HD806DRAFT_538163 [Xylariaceae sp. AK1471]|nr:hypothetical protein HD806DRAFT_538163 [Xylariaceae sp. AK1471]
MSKDFTWPGNGNLSAALNGSTDPFCVSSFEIFMVPANISNVYIEDTRSPNCEPAKALLTLTLPSKGLILAALRVVMVQSGSRFQSIMLVNRVVKKSSHPELLRKRANTTQLPAPGDDGDGSDSDRHEGTATSARYSPVGALILAAT